MVPSLLHLIFDLKKSNEKNYSFQILNFTPNIYNLKLIKPVNNSICASKTHTRFCAKRRRRGKSGKEIDRRRECFFVSIKSKSLKEGREKGNWKDMSDLNSKSFENL